MHLHDQLAAMADAMPDGATLSFTKPGLLALLEDTHSGPRDLTVEDVADNVGRSTATVRRWIRTNELDAYKLNRRDWRIPEGALADFLLRQRTPSIATGATVWHGRSERRPNKGRWRAILADQGKEAMHHGKTGTKETQGAE